MGAVPNANGQRESGFCHLGFVIQAVRSSQVQPRVSIRMVLERVQPVDIEAQPYVIQFRFLLPLESDTRSRRIGQTRKTKARLADLVGNSRERHHCDQKESHRNGPSPVGFCHTYFLQDHEIDGIKVFS